MPLASWQSQYSRILRYYFKAATTVITFSAFMFENALCLAWVYVALMHTFGRTFGRDTFNIRRYINLLTSYLVSYFTLNFGISH